MKKIFLALLFAGSFSGCIKDQSENFTNCTFNECAIVAPAAEIQQVKDYLAANSITATQHCSGLFYVVDVPGTGATPTVCNNIAFAYEGKLTDGTVFDKAETPIVYNLSQLITGFKVGIPKMKVGGKMRLYVPPSLGYGSNPPANGPIPSNAVLVFNVTLAGVQ